MSRNKAKAFKQKRSSNSVSQSQQICSSNNVTAKKSPRSFSKLQTFDLNELVRLFALLAIVVTLIAASGVSIWICLFTGSMNQPDMVLRGPEGVVWICLSMGGSTTLLIHCLKSLTSIAQSLIKK